MEGGGICGQDVMYERRKREIKYKEEEREGCVNCFTLKKARISILQSWKSVLAGNSVVFNVLELNDFFCIFSKLIREMIRNYTSI